MLKTLVVQAVQDIATAVVQAHATMVATAAVKAVPIS